MFEALNGQIRLEKSLFFIILVILNVKGTEARDFRFMFFLVDPGDIFKFCLNSVPICFMSGVSDNDDAEAAVSETMTELIHPYKTASDTADADQAVAETSLVRHQLCLRYCRFQ